MAKRESIWRAADGTEHRSKQSAAVADAEHALSELWDVLSTGEDPARAPTLHVGVVLDNLPMVAAAVGAIIKARAALAKHTAKGDQ